MFRLGKNGMSHVVYRRLSLLRDKRSSGDHGREQVYSWKNFEGTVKQDSENNLEEMDLHK